MNKDQQAIPCQHPVHFLLNKWGEASWLKAEDEIFDKLAQVDTGLFHGSPVRELAPVGIRDYLFVYTSHHKRVYRQVSDDNYRYLVASHRQDFPTLLMKRLLRA